MARRKLPLFGKILVGIFGFIMIGLATLYLIFNERMPEGERGAEAEALARKVQKAINKPAWDSTTVVQWTFKGVHDFVWDKERHVTEVKWDDYRVLLDINAMTGKAYKGGVEITDEKEVGKLVNTAWKFWVNDSFWLNAPAKIFDPGTVRKVVDYEGEKALMITYGSGGVTPGDTYLWLLDDKGMPKAWKLWVKIIPFGGLEFSWENYETLPSGAQISTFHKSKILDLDISNLKSAQSVEELLGEDIFKGV